MTIELPGEFEAALKAKADACGVPLDVFVRQVFESQLRPASSDELESNGNESLTGAALVAAMQASPHKEIDLEPQRHRLPVRETAI